MTETTEELITSVRVALETAAETIIDSAMRGMELVEGFTDCPPGSGERLKAELHRIIEACAFGDLVNQRLSKLSSAWVQVVQNPDPLLGGPQADGGVGQAEVDAVFGSQIPRSS